jgi:DNA-binding transcriptional regulator LsrR (DeoR family)
MQRFLKGIPRNQWPLHVGISGGDTLFAVVNAIREEPRPDIHIHTTALIGWGEFERSSEESKEPPYHIDPITNATIFWNKAGRKAGRCHYATVPPLSGSGKNRPRSELERLYEIRPIRKTVDAMKPIRVAFAGLGIFSPLTRQDENKSQLTVATLLPDVAPTKELGAVVGDMSYTLFDKDGRSRPEWEFFLTAGFGEGRSGLRFYQDMVLSESPRKYVIVIAGMRKHSVLLPALRQKFFNVWITDAESAISVLAGRRVSRGRAGKVLSGG